MVKTDKQKINEILTRGVDEIIEEEHLRSALLSGKKLSVKFGIDPTSPDLHLGHSVPLRKLRQFQELGHRVILLIGDFTATIGDPSGRMAQRPQLTEEQVRQNMKDYIEQAGKILDIKETQIRYNSEWYRKKEATFLMELASKFTIARIIERDDFKKRIKDDVDISMLELIYPLLQGYDSVELKADVEIGGRDQKFNLLMGRKVQKRYNMPEQDIMTFPLLLGLDGSHKMSKSLGNCIGLNESSKDVYGKVMSLPDGLMWNYFSLLTDISSGEINELKLKVQKLLVSPRDAKARLAKEIVKLYHGEKQAEQAEQEFNKIFRDKGLPSDMPVFEIPKGYPKKNYPVLDLLCDSGLASSKNEAKRLIEGNAVEIKIKNQKSKIKNWKENIILENNVVVKVGSRRFVKIKLK